MIINHNMMAMNADRMANINSNNASKAMEKLSSGLRINSAADDAAGLAISEKMKGQINGLNQASSNAQDGVSLVQTADGALSETTSVLQRMRELAVQASNDTNTTADRQAIQTETQQLTAQIDNIATTTQFNTKNLLDGSCSVTGSVGTSLAGVTITGGTANTQVGASISITAVQAATSATTTGAAVGVTIGASTLTLDGAVFSFAAGTTTQSALDAINNAGLGVTASVNASGDMELDSSSIGSKASITVAGAAGAFAGMANAAGTDATLTATDGAGNAVGYTAQGDNITINSSNAQGLELNVAAGTNDNVASNNAVSVTDNGSIALQIGANAGQVMRMSINSMTSSALGVNNIDLTTQTGAEAAITKIDTATALVSTERANLGAYQNRLESTMNSLGTTSQNLTSAQSAITDVDMAAEMAEYSKDNVESQAAQAMLAQANQNPQQVLQLLR